MSSQISHGWLVDGLAVHKQDFRDEIDRIAAEMNHGGFYTRVGDGAANSQVASRLIDQFVSAVADFGAPINYSTATEAADASVAINNAINTVRAAWGRGTVYLPPGVFWISDPIILKSNVRLIGAGRNATMIKLKAGGATHLITNSAGTDTQIQIHDLTVDGNKFATGNSQTWYDGINLNSTIDSFHHIANVTIQQTTRDGLHFTGTRGVASIHNVFVANPWRFGFYCDTFDNIYTLCQSAGAGTDGIVTVAGPNRFVGGKSYFSGNNTSFFTDWPANPQGQAMLGSTSDGFDNTAPVQDDWRRGCGIRNTASLNEFIGVEIQDTWGPGFVEAGYETRFNGVIGNVGDLAPGGPRHNAAGSPDTNDRFTGVRAAVQLAAAYDCYFDFTTRAQAARFQVAPTMCDYIARITSSAAKNVKFRVLAATTNNSGGAATHVSNLAILESAPKDPTVELLVNAL
jgi:Pectate lyase superfamily protein